MPLDEGTLGLRAERVLKGDLPHRDFDDYTGGLTYLHAFAFRVFGANLISMRIVLFLFFAAWVPAVFYIASRFHAPYFAGAVTLVAVAWSVPRYTGPLPSWYNLFFATFGSAALLRFMRMRTRRWLFVAGICAGISALAKIIAAYFIAAALLFFLFREQNIANERNGANSARAPFYKLTVIMGLGVFLTLLYRLIHQLPGIGELVFFFLPTVGLVILIVAREFAGVAGRDGERFASLVGMCLPFTAGVATPLVLFFTPFARAGALNALFHGLAWVPGKAIESASLRASSPLAMIAVIPFALALILSYEGRRLARVIGGCLIFLYGGAILIFAGESTPVYKLGWSSIGMALPLLALLGIIKLWVSRAGTKWGSMGQESVMLLLCVAVLCSLVQFPFSPPIYFFYVAPLVILSASSLLTSARRFPTYGFGLLVAFYLILALLPATDYETGARHTRDGRTEKLDMARAGGLRVDPADARMYNQLIPLVRDHAMGRSIYAAPDCPEVYFLSGIESPSRHYFDFAEDAPGMDDRTLAVIENLSVNVVAINNSPRFSKPMSPSLRNGLEERFPYSADIGTFQVRWRE